MNLDRSESWLALLHQLPAKPPYLRVKIWRRLQMIGAVPLKNAVHVLPHCEENHATFRALMKEIISSGGDAILLEARLLGGQGDGDVRSLFDTARDSEYEEISAQAHRLIETGPARGSEIVKLRKRLDEVIRLDFFGAHGRQDAEAALADLDRQRYQHPDVSRVEPLQNAPIDLIGKTWVTRSGVHVDRIACAWLIGRFVDPAAVFCFVDARSCEPQDGDLRFDMADAEFTHEGDRCSFETLMMQAGLAEDVGLVAIAEMIHDLDVADGKFGRPETTGLGAMLSGVCASTEDDLQRIAMGGEALNQFYAYFSGRKADR
jgi:hypothetical protein